MTRGGGFAMTISTLLFSSTLHPLKSSSSVINCPKTGIGRCMIMSNKVGRRGRGQGNIEVQSNKHKVQLRDEEKHEGGWIPHPRTGIYYPKGHEWVMEDVPDGAASFAYNYWFRNTDN